jgi:thiol-disulfide isomerase/thioredoxin
MSCLIKSRQPVTICSAVLLGLLICVAQSGRLAADEKAAGQDPAKAAEAPQNPFPEAVMVPDGILEGGTEWLNTSQPLDLKDLRGKIVVLDFWTYCCINCMHVLPDLKFLEEKYGNQLVVIGVHSAKFDNEKVSQNIRDAIVRYEIQHPVVNDSEMLIWRKFGTRAWPTLALIDPEGKYAGSQSGEGNRELFDNVIGKLVEYHRWKGTLDETPIVFQSEASKVQPTPLRYPGKVFADAAGQRLFITDSNHNRIVVTSMARELQTIIGSGRNGRADGTFEAAEFNRPQGTVLVGNKLYVADTENHLIRVADLDAKTVSTLAGNGRQGQPGGIVGGTMLETSLNSPWSIAHTNGLLFIAMAGPHQVWAHQIGTNLIGVYAGSGREDVINGSLATSAFAQPSEIVSDAAGKFLYLVDSEGSAIRKVPTNPSGEVTTVAGTSELPRGQSLFAFGDVDAAGKNARFQHPLGIAISGETLFVADSYNHKLKTIDLDKRKSVTWAGSGKPGNTVDPLLLNEPGGLSIADGKLYVADTNNHRILTIDIASKQTTVLTINGLTPPNPPKQTTKPETTDAIAVEPQKLAAGDKLKFNVTLTIPDGHKRNDLAPVTWEIFAESEQSIIAADVLGVRDEATANDQNVAVFEVPLSGAPGEATFIVRMSFGYCGTEENALCRLATATWKIPVVLNTDGGASEIALTFPKP